MSKLEVDAIEPQSGTTLTIGASGDSVNIASGATITDFTSTGIDDNATSTAITIDSSERVGIGTGSPTATLNIQSSTDASIDIDATSGSTQDTFIKFTSPDNGTAYLGVDDSEQLFKINNTSALSSSNHFVIDNSGNVGIGTGSPANPIHVEKDVFGNIVARFVNTNSSAPYGHLWDFSAASPDNRTRYFLTCQDSTTSRLRIWSDGDVQNHDGTYGTLSDERIKQNITDANNQWNDIKSLKIKNFKKKDDVIEKGEANAPTHLGVIAQELEQTSPGLVAEYACSENEASLHSDFTDWENATVKGVKYSILYMKAVKALQEAMERIETLEAKNTELEDRITELENK